MYMYIEPPLFLSPLSKPSVAYHSLLHHQLRLPPHTAPRYHNTHMLSKDDQSLEFLCQLQHKARVIPELLDGSFVARVEEEGATALPVSV